MEAHDWINKEKDMNFDCHDWCIVAYAFLIIHFLLFPVSNIWRISLDDD